MRFSVKWAGAAPAYVGMIAGAVAMTWTARTIDPFHIGIAVLFGGGVALPLAGCNFLVALLVAWMTRGKPFATQFGAFAVLALAAYFMVLNWLDESMQTMGGVMNGTKDVLLQLAFFAASLAMALICMAIAAWHAQRATLKNAR